jgi:parallel beta-helix repeat protein/predicted outer membrane repeat protein
VYRIRVIIEDPVNRTSASESGVAHIYGGKETSLEFNFTPEQFVAEIPLTVTANLTLPDGVTADPNTRVIAVYRDEDCTNPTGGFERKSPDESDSVTFWIPTYEGETVYLRQEFVVGGLIMYLGEPYEVEIDSGSPAAVELRDTYFKVDVEQDITNGTIFSNQAIALPEAEITLTVRPGSGKKLRPGSLKYNSEPIVETTDETTYTFVMPGADVTIHAEFVDYGIRYVTQFGAGDWDGSSWENASNFYGVQKMMDELAALPSSYTDDRIVKLGAGTHRPNYAPMVPSDPAVLENYQYNTSPVDRRDIAFMLRPGVQVWGGYPESGGNDDTRDPATNVTILSGDLDNSDLDNSGNLNMHDAYHVVLAVNIPANSGTVLDGLTISGGGGNPNGTGDITLNDNPIPRNSGGGIYNYNSSLTLTNVIISNNRAGDSGGGVYVKDGTFTMSGGEISGNTANGTGGGVHVEGGTFTMSEGTIRDNESTESFGGGVYVNNGTFTMSGDTTTIEGNKATEGFGGGVYMGNSGMFTMEGGTISGNTAMNGGGVWTGGSYPPGAFTMSGGTISGNTAIYTDSDPTDPNPDFGNGGGVYVAGGTFTKTGGIIYGDTDTNHDADSTENTATSGNGHAVYVSGDSTQNENNDVSETDNLDIKPSSDSSGDAGGR